MNPASFCSAWGVLGFKVLDGSHFEDHRFQSESEPLGSLGKRALGGSKKQIHPKGLYNLHYSRSIRVKNWGGS